VAEEDTLGRPLGGICPLYPCLLPFLFSGPLFMESPGRVAFRASAGFSVHSWVSTGVRAASVSLGAPCLLSPHPVEPTKSSPLKGDSGLLESIPVLTAKAALQGTAPICLKPPCGPG
jgi:hypothetical protein